jgi:multidrug resistance efflux pump
MASKSRFSRWLGTLLVLGIVGGAIYVLVNNFRPKGAGEAAADAQTEAAKGPQPVACLGYVDLAAGVASLTTVQPARVIAVLASDNQPVKVGTVLATTDDRAAREAIKEAEVALAAAKEQLDHARRSAGRHKIQLRKAEAAIAAARARLEAAQRAVELKTTLRELQQANAKEVAVAEQQVREAEAGVTVEEASQAELELVDPQQPVRQAEVAVQRAEAALAQARALADGQQLRAPADGAVLRVLTRPGQIVSAAAPAMLFAADGPRIVRAEVEQSEVDRVAVGAAATIEDDAVSNRSWRGKVVQLADWYAKRRTILDEATPFTDVPTVECLISIDDSQTPPRIGQRVRVRIERAAR